MNTHLDNSEIVAGMVIKAVYDPKDSDVTKISPNAVRPELFSSPYDALIKDIKKGKPREDIVSSHLNAYQTCLQAVDTLNGAGKDTDWVAILAQSAAEYQAGVELERAAKNLQSGKGADWVKLQGIVKKAQLSENLFTYTPLSDVKRERVPFIKTGWNAVDTHLGGIPAFGLITLMGYPKSGKTTALAKLVSKFAQTHDKVVAVHTYEMIQGELGARFDEVEKLPKEAQQRILLRDIPENTDQAVNVLATTENLGLAVFDFVDYMVKGETNEASMSYVYKTLATTAKQLRIPILLLAQLSGAKGGIPRPQEARYTRLAEAYAWMVLSVYNPGTQRHYDNPDKKLLPITNGVAYLVCWLVRGGFRMHQNKSPGAIAMGFKGSKGWSNKGTWYQIRE